VLEVLFIVCNENKVFLSSREYEKYSLSVSTYLSGQVDLSFSIAAFSSTFAVLPTSLSFCSRYAITQISLILFQRTITLELGPKAVSDSSIYFMVFKVIEADLIVTFVSMSS
jgi:hypothetical protein